DVASLLRTYTALAGSSPTSTTLSPGTMPSVFSLSTSDRTSAWTRSAIAAPSMTFPRTRDVTPGATLTAARLARATSPRKVDGPRLTNQYDLDLTRILELGLDAAG